MFTIALFIYEQNDTEIIRCNEWKGLQSYCIGPNSVFYTFVDFISQSLFSGENVYLYWKCE